MNQTGRLLVILIGCSTVLTIVLLVHSRSKNVNEVNTASNNKVANELRFRSTAIFDGKTEDGAAFVDRMYKASDCVVVAHRTTFFKSPSRAREELDVEVKNAEMVIERAPVMDNGEQIGERVLRRLNASEHNKTATEVIWTNNSEFHSLASRSTEHVLQFEKALQNRSEKIFDRLDSSGNLTFTEVETREGNSEQGIPFSEKKFRSSDCEFVTLRIERFPSSDSARQELEAMLARSTNVMERGPKSDPQGRILGERAVANFTARVSSGHIEDTVVLWTNGSELHSITGIFNYVLVFEKQNQ